MTETNEGPIFQMDGETGDLINLSPEFHGQPIPEGYHIEGIVYCKHIMPDGEVCGQALRFRKKDKKWVHVYSPAYEPYGEFLKRTDHPAELGKTIDWVVRDKKRKRKEVKI